MSSYRIGGASILFLREAHCLFCLGLCKHINELASIVPLELTTLLLWHYNYNTYSNVELLDQEIALLSSVV